LKEKPVLDAGAGAAENAGLAVDPPNENAGAGAPGDGLVLNEKGTVAGALVATAGKRGLDSVARAGVVSSLGSRDIYFATNCRIGVFKSFRIPHFLRFSTKSAAISSCCLLAPPAEVEAVADFGAAKVVDVNGFEAAGFASGISVVDPKGMLGSALGVDAFVKEKLPKGLDDPAPVLVGDRSEEGVAAFCFQALQWKETKVSKMIAYNN
jgi:hypothetical protein